MPNHKQKYLVGYGNEGLEWLINISSILEEDKEIMIKKLSDINSNNKIYHSKLNNTIHSLMLRSRFNVHRNIKNYFFETEVSEDYLRNLLEDNKTAKNILKKKFEIKIY